MTVMVSAHGSNTRSRPTLATPGRTQPPIVSVVDEPLLSRADIDRRPGRESGLATASACFGIVSIFLGCLFVTNVLAIVLGVAALVQCHEDPTYTNRRSAIGGVVLGVVTLVIWYVFWWMFKTKWIMED